MSAARERHVKGSMRTLVWFRGKDLRIADHAPLREAIGRGASTEREVVPLFVLDPFFFAKERAAELPNRVAYLLGSLSELAETIARLGSRLVVVAGKSVDVVPAIARELAVDRVVAHRWSEPFGRARDARISEALGAIPFELFEGETLAKPGDVMTGAGTPFSVFTPFARAFAKAVAIDEPLGAPRAFPALPSLPKSVRAREVAIPSPSDLGITPSPAIVEPGEKAAHARLTRFLRGPAARYPDGRNELGVDGTSRISQDLKFGTLTPRQVHHRAKEALADHGRAFGVFWNEIVWREFAYHVLYHRPDVLDAPFRDKWTRFPWRNDEAGWKAWVAGTTGYPVVDAAARQLFAEGFVHNRARMIAASFLTKHLLVDFRRGEAHYMKYLTDGDWASNDLGWQWSAGCGVDAQPWFRVFNPVTQGVKFDPHGAYVRRWVPELAKLGDRHIHRPWEAPAADLDRAGIVLGRTYPAPIVDHAFGRKRFLAAAQGHLG